LFTKEENVTWLKNDEGEWKKVKIQPNNFAFRLFGTTLVTYHNPKRLSTFGKNAAKAQSYRFEYHNGKESTVNGNYVKNPLAGDLRAGKINWIEVLLG
jgi:hypothetical protein